MTQNQLTYQRNKIAENEVAIKDRLANTQVSKDLKEYGPLVDEVTIHDWYPGQEMLKGEGSYQGTKYWRENILAGTQAAKNIGDFIKTMVGSFASLF